MKRDEPIAASTWAVVIMIFVLFAVKVAWARWAYDDWSCAFKRCIEVVRP